MYFSTKRPAFGCKFIAVVLILLSFYASSLIAIGTVVLDDSMNAFPSGWTFSQNVALGPGGTWTRTSSNYNTPPYSAYFCNPNNNGYTYDIYAFHLINLAGYDDAKIQASLACNFLDINIFTYWTGSDTNGGSQVGQLFWVAWDNTGNDGWEQSYSWHTFNAQLPLTAGYLQFQTRVCSYVGNRGDSYLDDVIVTGDHRPALSSQSISSVAGDNFSFTYGITYTDADNDVPSYIRVHVLQGGAEISGSPFAMSYQAGSYNTGAVYSYTAHLPGAGSNYTYYFDASDGWLAANNTSTFGGPTVINPSISGYLKDPLNNALTGINVALSGTSTANTITDSNGFYTFSGLAYGGNYTVTPASGTYGTWIYSQGMSLAFNNLTSNITNQNFNRLNGVNSAELQFTGVSNALSAPVVSTYTVVTYSYLYSDQDNDAPKTGYPRLHIYNNTVEIVGSPFTMTYQAGNFVSGATYYYTTTLSPYGNAYSYFAEAYNIYNASSTAPGLTSGPIVDRFPTISYASGLVGFTTSYVCPMSGDPSTTYVFNANYTNLNAEPPAALNPYLHILQGGAEIPGSPFTMSYQSGNYSTGATYRYQTTYSAGVNFSYWIGVTDALGVSTSTVLINGPYVGTTVSGTVRDPSGAPLPGINVFLTGPGIVTSTSTSSSNGTYMFLVSTNSYTITPSSFTYYSFSPAQINLNDTIVNTPGQDFIRLNSSPTFSASQMNYQTALTTQTFIFSVIYKDAENDAPAPGSLKVHILSNGVVTKTLPLTFTGNNYISGITCSSPGIIFSTAGHYTYYFEGTDIWGYSAYYAGDTGSLYFDVTDIPVGNFKNMSQQAQDGCNVISSKVTLSWSASDALGSAITYSLFFGQENNSSSSIARNSSRRPMKLKAPSDVSMICIYTGPNTSYTFTDMASGEVYYWQVQADNGRGSVSLSPAWSFNTINLPDEKVLNYPNPFRAGHDNTNIVFYASQSGSADLYIFSEFGKKLFHTSITFSPGTNSFSYNGKDDNGNVLMNGSYPYIVNVEGRRLKNVLLVVK